MGKTLISASLALAALSDAQQRVIDARNALAEATAERDDLIRDARAASIPYATLMARTRLSKDRLINIAKAPSRDEYEANGV